MRAFLIAILKFFKYNRAMKKILTSVAALSIAVLASGCAETPAQKPQIDFYTNATCAVEICYDGAFSHTIEGGQFTLGEPKPYSGLTNRSKSIYDIMNTDATVMVSADFTDDEVVARFDALCEEVTEVLNSVDNSLSVTVEASCISRFNEAIAGETVEIDKIAYEVLSIAMSIHEFTEGYYNPAVYYSVQVYGFNGTATGERVLPPSELTAEYAALSAHFSEIVLTEKDGKYYAKKPAATIVVGGDELSLKIDLGGVGKGYVADIVDGLFDTYGFEYGFFDFGSSSKALKKFAGTGEWTLGIMNPRASGDIVRLKVADVSVSSSGDYQQYFILDGVRYSHIIDPFTGEPTQSGIACATVIGGSAAENDALTTAIVCMGVERAEQFVREKLAARLVFFAAER